MSNIMSVTDANFEEVVLKSDKLVLVDFWAPWCGPCMTMGPVLDELAKDEELAKHALLVKMNIDENPETPAKNSVRSIPTFIVFKGGKVVAKQTGSSTRDKLKEFIMEAHKTSESGS